MLAQARLTISTHMSMASIEPFLDSDERLYVLSEEKKDKQRKYELLYYSRANEVRLTVHIQGETMTISETAATPSTHKYFHRLVDRIRTASSANDLLHQPLSPIFYRSEMLTDLIAGKNLLNLANYSYSLAMCRDLATRPELIAILTDGLKESSNRRYALTIMANLLKKCPRLPEPILDLARNTLLQPNDQIHAQTEHQRMKKALNELNLSSSS